MNVWLGDQDHAVLVPEPFLQVMVLYRNDHGVCVACRIPGIGGPTSGPARAFATFWGTRFMGRPSAAG